MAGAQRATGAVRRGRPRAHRGEHHHRERPRGHSMRMLGLAGSTPRAVTQSMWRLDRCTVVPVLDAGGRYGASGEASTSGRFVPLTSAPRPCRSVCASILANLRTVRRGDESPLLGDSLLLQPRVGAADFDDAPARAGRPLRERQSGSSTLWRLAVLARSHQASRSRRARYSRKRGRRSACGRIRGHGCRSGIRRPT